MRYNKECFNHVYVPRQTKNNTAGILNPLRGRKSCSTLYIILQAYN